MVNQPEIVQREDPKDWLYWGCPGCAIERTDYEGPGQYLPACPSCGSRDEPMPMSEI